MKTPTIQTILQSRPAPSASLFVDGQLFATGQASLNTLESYLVFFPKDQRLLDTECSQAILIVDGKAEEPIDVVNLRQCPHGKDHWDMDFLI